MLIIAFYDRSDRGSLRELTGDQNSIYSLANILERNKIYFKVGMRGAHLSQEQLGYGGFKYWMKPEDNFGQGG